MTAGACTKRGTRLRQHTVTRGTLTRRFHDPAHIGQHVADSGTALRGAGGGELRGGSVEGGGR
jgi:hypothetical protein